MPLKNKQNFVWAVETEKLAEYVYFGLVRVILYIKLP